MLKSIAIEMGFVDYGAIPVEPMNQDLAMLMNFLDKGRHGSMGYLARNLQIRENPSLLLEGAKSIAVLLVPYGRSIEGNSDNPKIASYALGLDYHDVIKRRLHKFSERMLEIYPGSSYRVFTDSAPLFERSMAARAGLGFIGKNTFLISKSRGLNTLIGVIITDAQLDYSSNVVKSGCGECRRCLDACPTGALLSAGEIDATRCLSYITIEKRPFSHLDTAPSEHNTLFGCDICMDVCPWSGRGGADEWIEFKSFQLSDGRWSNSLSVDDWMKMEVDFFKREFRNSPLLRAGLARIKIITEQIKQRDICGKQR